MNLAVFSGQYFWFDGAHYSTDEAFAGFVTSFHPYFEKIIFCDSVTAGKGKKAYTLDPKNAEVCPLPNYSVYSFWKNVLIVFPMMCRIIRQNIQKWDIIWLHAPHPASLIFTQVCRKARVPFFFFVRQNLPTYVKCRNRGPRRILAVAVAMILDYVFRLLSHKTLTFAVGGEIYNQYRKSGKAVHEVTVSLISESDITHTIARNRKMTRNPQPTRLLSVGRLAPEKGVIYVVRAVSDLVASGNRDISLEVVGEGVEEERLRGEVVRLGLDEYITFRGYISYSEELLSLYRKCDIYILPSLTEGWPQTLYEAMACGVPVIATKVGGIPHLIDDGDNGLLVNPGSPREICDAIKRIMGDFALRARLIENGLATARNHTLELERGRIIDHIEQFFAIRGRSGCTEGVA